MNKKATSKFWNSSKQVSAFAQDKPSLYLVDFFSKIKHIKHQKVLDLGCGGGRNTEMILKLGFDVFACDLHKGMIIATRKRVKKLDVKKAKKIILASMINLPYEDNLFDYVVSNGVFHNVSSLEEFEQTTKECCRVLKNGGILVLNMFFQKIVDSNLVKLKNKKFLYITPQKLPMLLLPDKEIIDIFKDNNLHSVSSIKKSDVVISTGKRSILRGLFKKSI